MRPVISTATILIILTAIAAYSLFSKSLEKTVFTMPMIFTALGLLLGQFELAVVPKDLGNEVVHLIAEITLVIVLFTDSSRVRFKSLFAYSTIPVRMLTIGMPLTIMLGTLLAWWVSPEQHWTLAFLVAAILTPTDAALGQTVVTGNAVPSHLRQSINVESGLNDGLAFPIVLVAAILATTATGHTVEEAPENIVAFVSKQLTLGPLVGILVGLVSAKALALSVSRNSATGIAQGLFIVGTAVFAYFGAEFVGGNGFVAAFIGGLVFGNAVRSPTMFIHEFMEGEGQILTLVTFLIFGAVLAPVGLEHANIKTVALAIGFLTIVRMLPIWISLIGTDLGVYEKLFLGWFGPRGLASILFALLVLERFELPGTEEITACVVLTVLISIVVHGASAMPLSRLIQRKVPERSEGAV